MGVRKRVLGAEHPDTLTTGHTLASSLSGQGKYAEAEALEHEVLGVRKRVLGPDAHSQSGRRGHESDSFSFWVHVRAFYCFRY